MDERYVINTWRNLFRGKEITSDSLATAETMLEGLSGESPLHIRLAKELEELRVLEQKTRAPISNSSKKPHGKIH